MPSFFGWFNIYSTVGIKNAKDLPLPVFAEPIISSPFNAIGIDLACISVAVSYPWRVNRSYNILFKFISENFISEK